MATGRTQAATMLGLAVLATPFAWYAVAMGWSGFSGEAIGSRFWVPDAPLATAALFVHMGSGGILTVLAPLQAIGAVRRRWPSIHRITGRAVLTLAAVTSVTGLAAILGIGTIGGLWMSLGFAVYGASLGIAAAVTWRAAKAGDTRNHRAWATRLVVLALGSWIYRVHYGLWALATGGAGTASDFTGWFDRVQVWAFFVPYLLATEWALRRRGHSSKRSV